MRHQRRARSRHAKPIRLKIDHHCRHEFRVAVRSGQGGAWPRRDVVKDLDHHRRRRHDREGAAIQSAGLQYLPSRYGMNLKDLRRADAIEVVVSQGAARRRRHAARPKIRTGSRTHAAEGYRPALGVAPSRLDRADDLEIDPGLRELPTGKSRLCEGRRRRLLRHRAAVKAGADVVVVDGMQGGTAATQSVHRECQPANARLRRPAVQALQDLGMHRKAADHLGRHPQWRHNRWALALGVTPCRSAPQRCGARRQRSALGGRVQRARHDGEPMTTGTKGMTRPASRRRTRN